MAPTVGAGDLPPILPVPVKARIPFRIGGGDGPSSREESQGPTVSPGPYTIQSIPNRTTSAGM